LTPKRVAQVDDLVEALVQQRLAHRRRNDLPQAPSCRLGHDLADERDVHATLRLPSFRRVSCSRLCGLCSSHMTHFRLQSSGLVSNVIRHGAEDTSTRVASRRAIAPR
jgi:hypothetical protein